MRSDDSTIKSRSAVTHESVTSESSGVRERVQPRHLDRNGLSLSWRCLQLFNEGNNTMEIATIVAAERPARPGSKPINEAKVYNALSKARDDIYERGLTMPRVNTVGDITSGRSE